MEFKNLEELERQVHRLLERFQAIRQERDELTARVEHQEVEVAELRRANRGLRRELEKARHQFSDNAKQEQIKAKIEALISRLEEF
jgi:uncharacterized coiled-coil DUF342 family protein